MKKLFFVGVLVVAAALAYVLGSRPENTLKLRTVENVLSGAIRSFNIDKGKKKSAVEPLQKKDAALLGERERQGDSFRLWKEPLTGMEFVWLPTGCFRMGGSPEEKDHDSDELPVHRVCVDGFWIGRYEVTRAQFRAFVEQTGYVTDAEKEGYSWIYTGKWEKKPGYSWRRVGFAQNGDHPVVNVSWNDAKAMAEWLSTKDGRRFRLPTEAEWEYACRAGTASSRFWGDDPAKACDYANVADLSAQAKYPVWTIHPCRDGFVYTAPVGSFRSNPFGLYDMLGNVWEWCEDVYRADAYRFHEGRDPLVTKGGQARVIRGGSWYSRPKFVRCASRDHLSFPSRRSHDQGFRLVMPAR